MPPINDLPRKSASLDNQGFQKLLTEVRTNPMLGQRLASEIERSPRAAIAKYFRLSSDQTEAIHNASDDELRSKAAPLVHALRSGEIPNMTYHPGDSQDGSTDMTLHCLCWFSED